MDIKALLLKSVNEKKILHGTQRLCYGNNCFLINYEVRGKYLSVLSVKKRSCHRLTWRQRIQRKMRLIQIYKTKYKKWMIKNDNHKGCGDYSVTKVAPLTPRLQLSPKKPSIKSTFSSQGTMTEDAPITLTPRMPEKPTIESTFISQGTMTEDAPITLTPRMPEKPKIKSTFISQGTMTEDAPITLTPRMPEKPTIESTFISQGTMTEDAPLPRMQLLPEKPKIKSTFTSQGTMTEDAPITLAPRMPEKPTNKSSFTSRGTMTDIVQELVKEPLTDLIKKDVACNTVPKNATVNISQQTIASARYNLNASSSITTVKTSNCSCQTDLTTHSQGIQCKRKTTIQAVQTHDVYKNCSWTQVWQEEVNELIGIHPEREQESLSQPKQPNSIMIECCKHMSAEKEAVIYMLSEIGELVLNQNHMLTNNSQMLSQLSDMALLNKQVSLGTAWSKKNKFHIGSKSVKSKPSNMKTRSIRAVKKV